MKPEGDNRRAAMIALAEKAARELEGTCMALYNVEGVEEEGAEDSTAFCNRLDELVFECTACNWWCSQDECNEDSSGQWVCAECKADD